MKTRNKNIETHKDNNRFGFITILDIAETILAMK